jgi:DNA primase large subunit
VKEDGTWGAAELETIVHPNEYFKRSYLLKNLGQKEAASEEEEKADVKMED